jgi:hypothetical protein
MQGPALDPEDETLLQRFGRQAIGLDEWTHEMHLRVGWMHARRFGPAEALTRLRDGIRRLNDANGIVNSATSGYHETVTRVWIALIDAADALDGRTASSSRVFVDGHPELYDTRLPLRFYTRDRIVDEVARAGWVEPDLQPLPTGSYNPSSTSGDPK